MTPEERQMLAGLFERINAAGAAPRDRDAEAFINDAVRGAPFAPYVLAQTVLVQQHALEAAARASPISRRPRSMRLSRLRIRAASSAISAGRFSAAAAGAPSSRLARAMIRPIQQQPQQAPGYAPPPPSGYAPQRPGPWGGAPRARAVPRGGAAAFCRTPRRPRRASPAASFSAIFWAACSAAIRAAGLFGGGSNAGFFGGAPGGGNETVNIFEDGAGPQRSGPVRPEHARRRRLPRRFVVRRQFGRRLRRRVSESGERRPGGSRLAGASRRLCRPSLPRR